ncbi:hypothetical protein GALL_551740 [mine drainage metagenome]|uniref:Uncharacterized protein n=1 Tax=mine drainage metagenome TaxID=410659 RepID=A0A1J5NX07_9ZZZZ
MHQDAKTIIQKMVQPVISTKGVAHDAGHALLHVQGHGRTEFCGDLRQIVDTCRAQPVIGRNPVTSLLCRRRVCHGPGIGPVQIFQHGTVKRIIE